MGHINRDILGNQQVTQIETLGYQSILLGYFRAQIIIQMVIFDPETFGQEGFPILRTLQPISTAPEALVRP